MQIATPTPNTIDLRFYWRQIRKRPWLIAAIMVVSLALGILYIAKTKPLYRATAKLLIERDQSKVAPFEELVTAGQTGAHYETQFQILKSRVLARRVIDTLGLHNHPEFAPQAPESRVAKQALYSGLESVTRLVKGALVPSQTSEVAEPQTAAPLSDTVLVDNFLARLNVESALQTHLVNISFDAHQPNLAANATNTLARLYMEFNMEMRFADLQDAIDWLQNQVGDMRREVEASEMALQEYKDKHNVHLIDDRLPGLMQEITALRAALTQTKTERIELEMLYKELKRADKEGDHLDWMPAVVENALIQSLKTRAIDLQRNFVHYKQKYGVDHPRTLQLRAQLQAIDNKIAQEIKQIIRAFNTKYKLARTRERTLANEINSLKEEVRSLNDKAVRYGVLKREAESNQRLGDMLLNRMKEASVSSDLSNGNKIRIIDSAEVPSTPINIRPTLTLSIAGLSGLLVGVGLVAFMGYLDNTIKSAEEAEEFLGLPVAGVIEQYRLKRGTKSTSEAELITLTEPRSLATEAFKALRANLLFSYADPPRKVYLVTSPHPHDGKTTVAANLATVMAQAERRVLLIDADLRHASIHKRFDLENENGLSEMLLTESYDYMISVTEEELFIVTAGTLPPNPSELLGSKRMQRFLTFAREHYDTIIIDSPPILAVSDAVVLSPLVDGILVVLRAGATPYDHARRATNAFLSLQAELSEQAASELGGRSDTTTLNLVMNFLDPREGTSYGYGGYQSYYYGRSA